MEGARGFENKQDPIFSCAQRTPPQFLIPHFSFLI